jgi:hypothetical protein
MSKDEKAIRKAWARAFEPLPDAKEMREALQCLIAEGRVEVQGIVDGDLVIGFTELGRQINDADPEMQLEIARARRSEGHKDN